jgi:drug/metabolite transporter (DMT)-like permease
MDNRLRPLIYLTVVAFIGGSVSTFSKLALQNIPAFAFAFLRLALGAVIGYLLIRLAGVKISWNSFKLFAPVAIFWWLNALVFTFGLQRTTATTAQFIHISIPIITALLGIWILKHRLNTWQWLGTIIAAAGVSLVILSGDSLSFNNKSFVGNLIIFSSGVIFSFYAVLSQRGKYKNIHAFEMIFIGAVCGTIVSLPLAVVEYVHKPWLSGVPAKAWWSALAAGVIITVFYGGLQSLLNKFGSSYGTLTLYLMPAFVIFWASVLLGEKVTFKSVLGAAIALVGVWIVTKSATTTTTIPTPE